MTTLLWGRKRRAEHSCPLRRVTVGRVPHFHPFKHGEVATCCKMLSFTCIVSRGFLTINEGGKKKTSS